MAASSYGSGGPEGHHELAAVGPVIDIEIAGLGPLAIAVNCRGLIDTGASVVCIDERIARKLDLPATDEQAVSLASGETITSRVYTGLLRVPQLKFSQPMPLFAVSSRQSSHNVLLGRSFLRHFIVTFNGPEGIFHFYPPGGAGPRDPFDDYAT